VTDSERFRGLQSDLVGVIVGALGGIFTLEGPLNSGNGSVAGIAGPVGVLITWTLAVSVSWLTSDGSEPTAGPDEKAQNREASGDAPGRSGSYGPGKRWMNE
jgi:hypothetical protein